MHFIPLGTFGDYWDYEALKLLRSIIFGGEKFCQFIYMLQIHHSHFYFLQPKFDHYYNVMPLCNNFMQAKYFK